MLSVYLITVQPELSADCHLGGVGPETMEVTHRPGGVRRQHFTAMLLLRNLVTGSPSETSQTHIFDLKPMLSGSSV